MVTRVYWRPRGPLSNKMKPNRTLLAIFIDVYDVIVDICSGVFASSGSCVKRANDYLPGSSGLVRLLAYPQSETRSLWLCQPYYSTAQNAMRGSVEYKATKWAT